MKMNRTSLLLLSAGLLTGVGGAIGLQVYAQSAPVIATPVVQAPQVVTPVITAPDAVKADTDNIKDPGGKEQVDATEQSNGDTDNIQDPGGVEVPDATSTVAGERDPKDEIGQDKGEREDGTNEKGGTDTAGEAAGD